MPELKIGLVLECASVEEWEAWLGQKHASESEAWLRFAGKNSEAVTVSRAEALEVALYRILRRAIGNSSSNWGERRGD